MEEAVHKKTLKLAGTVGNLKRQVVKQEIKTREVLEQQAIITTGKIATAKLQLEVRMDKRDEFVNTRLNRVSGRVFQAHLVIAILTLAQIITLLFLVWGVL